MRYGSTFNKCYFGFLNLDLSKYCKSSIKYYFIQVMNIYKLRSGQEY